MIAFTGIGLLIGLGIGLPIAATLIAVALMGILTSHLPVGILTQRIFVQLDSFPLLAAPLFILAGALMDRGGISARLMEFAQSVVGHLRGGLAHVSVMTSLIMSGVSGSETADTAAIGSVMIPEMKKRGYRVEFATAVVAAAGGMALLIPPSITLLMYGFVSNTSIGALFMAGVIPGILICCMGFLGVYFVSRRESLPIEPAFSGERLWITFKRAFFALLMPLIILSGLRFGVTTITEAAVVAVVYAFLVGAFVYRDLRLRDMPEILAQSSMVTGVVMVVIGCAAIFSWYLTSQQIPAAVSAFMTSLTDNKYVILLLINILLLALGCIFEITAALIMTVPILHPVAVSYGIDPVHLGVVICANLGIGLVSPPVGMCLNVACGIAKVPVTRVIGVLFPLIAWMIAAVALITYVPAISLFLPRLLLGYGQ